jgi:hypothetical protein
METPQKTCTKCGISKSLDEFHENSTKRTGKTSHCKACVHAYSVAYKDKPKRVVEEKTCAKCGIVKPLNDYGKDLHAPDGMTYRCKACVKLHDNGRKKQPVLVLKEKPCTKCAIVKPIDDFGYCAGRRDGREAQCKTCKSIASKKFRKENLVQLREYMRRYTVQWRKKNLDAIRARQALHAEERREYENAWRAANPDKVHAAHQRRQALKNNAPVNDLTAEQWEEIQRAFQFRCAYCPKDCKECKKKTHALTRDHVTPYSHNGSNTLWNVVPACKSHNSQKHTGPPLLPVQPLLLTIAPAYQFKKK